MNQEFKAKHLIENIFRFLKNDILCNEKGKSIVDYYFKDCFGFKDENGETAADIAKKILLTEPKDRLSLEISFAYDSDRKKDLNLLIFYSSERDSSGNNAMSAGSYMEGDYYSTAGKMKSKTNTRFHDAKITFTAIANNSFVSTVLKNLVACSIISVWDEIHYLGFMNPKISIQDISHTIDLNAKGSFFHNVNLEFMDEIAVPSFDLKEVFIATKDTFKIGSNDLTNQNENSNGGTYIIEGNYKLNE